MRRVLALALIATATTFAASSRAADDPARIFQEAEKAYTAGDYRRAATLFEQANALRPHSSALWNAAHAREKAGEKAVAAMLYAKLLRDAPNSADAASARSSLAGLVPLIARIAFKGEGSAKHVDGIPVDDPLVYVEPGSHTIDATVDGKPFTKVVEAKVNDLVVVELVAASAPPPSTSPPPPPSIERKPESPSRGLPLIIAVGVGAATVVVGGFTIWSGIDTGSARTGYEANPTDAGFDDGQSRMTRTNILLGVTIGLAALTGAALIFTDFSAPMFGRSARLSIGPGGVAGAF